MENKEETRMPASRHNSPPLRRKTNSMGQLGHESIKSGNKGTDERNAGIIDESVVISPSLGSSTNREGELSQHEEIDLPPRAAAQDSELSTNQQRQEKAIHQSSDETEWKERFKEMMDRLERNEFTGLTAPAKARKWLGYHPSTKKLMASSTFYDRMKRYRTKGMVAVADIDTVGRPTILTEERRKEMEEEIEKRSSDGNGFSNMEEFKTFYVGYVRLSKKDRGFGNWSYVDIDLTDKMVKHAYSKHVPESVKSIDKHNWKKRRIN